MKLYEVIATIAVACTMSAYTIPAVCGKTSTDMADSYPIDTTMPTTAHEEVQIAAWTAHVAKIRAERLNARKL